MVGTNCRCLPFPESIYAYPGQENVASEKDPKTYYITNFFLKLCHGYFQIKNVEL